MFAHALASHRRHPLGLAALLSLLLPGCVPADTVSLKVQSSQTPSETGAIAAEIDAVEILPGKTFAAAGVSFLLEARLLRSDSVVTDPSSSVTWSAQGTNGSLLTFTPVTALKTIVTVPTWSQLNVPVSNPPFLTISGITATAGTVQSDPATIVVGRPPGDIGAQPDYDYIELPHSAGAAPAAVLLDTKTPASPCLPDTLIMVAGLAYLDTNLVGGCPPDPALGDTLPYDGGPTVAVFWPDRERYFADRDTLLQEDSLSDGNPLWTDDLGDRLAISDGDDPDSAVVTLKVWNGTDPGEVKETDLRDELKGSMELLRQIFERSRTGIQVKLAKGTVNGVPDSLFRAPLAPGENWVNYTLDECKTPETLVGPLAPGPPSLIHVLLVKTFLAPTGGEVSSTAQSCPVNQAGSNTLIAIDFSGVLDPGKLAHELGHVLGLELGLVPHASGGAGFDCSDVMTAPSACERDRFTVGQVYRLNNQVNWAWLEQAGIRKGHRTCQKVGFGNPDTVGLPCPRLSVDVPATHSGGTP